MFPVTIEKDAVRIANATIGTDESKIALSASLQHLNSPLVDAQLNANLSLPELQRSIAIPIDAMRCWFTENAEGEVSIHTDDNTKVIQVQTAHLGLGETRFEAEGFLRGGPRGSSAQFSGNLALSQLARLFKVSSPEVSGAVLLNGKANLDAQNNYLINGAINTLAVSIRSGSAILNNVSLRSPFHADPYLISLDGLRLDALGGGLAAKVFLEKMRTLERRRRLEKFLAACSGDHSHGQDARLRRNDRWNAYGARRSSE